MMSNRPELLSSFKECDLCVRWPEPHAQRLSTVFFSIVCEGNAPWCRRGLTSFSMSAKKKETSGCDPRVTKDDAVSHVIHLYDTPRQTLEIQSALALDSVLDYKCPYQQRNRGRLVDLSCSRRYDANTSGSHMLIHTSTQHRTWKEDSNKINAAREIANAMSSSSS
jgi:hypothetical protein